MLGTCAPQVANSAPATKNCARRAGIAPRSAREVSGPGMQLGRHAQGQQRDRPHLLGRAPAAGAAPARAAPAALAARARLDDVHRPAADDLALVPAFGSAPALV